MVVKTSTVFPSVYWTGLCCLSAETKYSILELSSASLRNWNDGMMECWPPARRAYASERIMGFGKMGKWFIVKISLDR